MASSLLQETGCGGWLENDKCLCEEKFRTKDDRRCIGRMDVFENNLDRKFVGEAEVAASNSDFVVLQLVLSEKELPLSSAALIITYVTLLFPASPMISQVKTKHYCR
jgi:hypothetical protein